MKKIFLAIIVALAMSVGILNVNNSYATDCPSGVVDPEMCFNTTGGDGVGTLGEIRGHLGGIADIIATIVGALAVLMIIYNGMLYTFSMGDPGKAGKAKQGIIFAITGVFLAVIAKTIVAFVASAASVGSADAIAPKLLSIGKWFATIAGAGCVLAVAYGGLQMVMSAGNPQKVQMAKKCIIAGFIGVAIIVFASTIVAIVVGVASKV